jgi:ferric-dicitrate binding protein FerR (iron transport regulator)
VGSVLTYYDDFNNGKRDVHLEGEGLFSVVPDSDAPFRVFTGNSVIQVTGTTFSVYQKNEITEVAVLEGKVLLSSAEDSEKQFEILQNQSGYLNEDGLAIRKGLIKMNYPGKQVCLY